MRDEALSTVGVYWYLDFKTKEVRRKPNDGLALVKQFFWKKKHTVGQLYVYPSLLTESAFTARTSITCRAVVGKDKQGKQGWRALTLEATDDRNKIHQDPEAL